eukprot:TRINITY_DN1001_c0_g3_i1.p1 TRINITY_DN1001_c0_g3~~TRINITY_DN1001_c0_g3_i1.p1  ORF type:complete len:201 (-),score=43.16 TRINITY_DN1001_c0_g3_i1:102-704(-)
MASVQESLKFLVLSSLALAAPGSLSTPFIVLAFCQAGLLLESSFKVEVENARSNAVSKKTGSPSSTTSAVTPKWVEKFFASVAANVQQAPYLTTLAFMVVLAQLYVIMLQQNQIPVSGNLLGVGVGFSIHAGIAFSLVLLLEGFLCQRQESQFNQINTTGAVEESDDEGEVELCNCGKNCGSTSWEECPYGEDFWADFSS